MNPVAMRNRPDDRLLELGGGACPIVRPACQGGRDVNADIRPAAGPDGRPAVDVTCDFNAPLPFADGEFDGVVSRYAIEHLSWRSVRAFVAEMYRVVKPGGLCTVITANTEAQFEWIRNNPDGWDGRPFFESASCVLFGDQDYPENAHKNFMSLTEAARLFREAGFADIVTQPFGARHTDLVLSARKPDSPLPAAPAPARGTQLPQPPAADKPLLSKVSKETASAWKGSFVIDADDPIPRYRHTAPAGASGAPGGEGRFVGEEVRDLSASTINVRVGGRDMLLYHPQLDTVSAALVRGDYELFESQCMRLLTRPGDTAIDIGAHVGHYTMLLAEAVGVGGQVIAFEPFGLSNTILGRNVRAAGFDDRVTVMPYALSDADGASSLYINPHNSGDNHLWSKEGYHCVRAEVRRLDALLDPSSRVDIVKIDTQGAEMQILRGMRNLLDAQKRVTVFVEMWPLGMKAMDATMEEFGDYFAGWQQAYIIWEDPPKLVPITKLDDLVKPGSSHFVNLIFAK